LALKAVQGTNTELTDGNSKISTFLFKALSRSYLKEQQPTIADIAMKAGLTYLFSLTDPFLEVSMATSSRTHQRFN
jgi:hypothetical protein